MPLPKQKNNTRFSYADYLTWPPEERWELIDGVAYDMTPASNVTHQILVGTLFRIIADHLEGKNCNVFLAPVDVRFPEHSNDSDENTFTVVQPDIVVVCDKKRLKSAE